MAVSRSKLCRTLQKGHMVARASVGRSKDRYIKKLKTF